MLPKVASVARPGNQMPPDPEHVFDAENANVRIGGLGQALSFIASHGALHDSSSLPVGTDRLRSG